MSKDINRVASGSVEDSSAACAGRIPKDASAGQKMLAAESCARDKPLAEKLVFGRRLKGCLPSFPIV